MSRIKRLPPEVFSRIAAGEVVERPASLLKELLENSLDAGASRIAVEAEGAGRALVRVADDGGGMDPEEVPLALERHATSKIQALEDLLSLKSFGFRGEALYAAAAVSKLSIRSSRPGAKQGWIVTAAAGKIASSGPCPAPGGTVVEVRDLFYNTPARLKFLKSDAYEKSKLVGVLEEAALANPEVQFSYKSEGRKSLHFPAADLPRRLKAVLGEELASGLVPIVVDRPQIKLKLFVSRPESMVRTREFQKWFVNRRPVDARLLQQALYKACGEHRRGGRHPACIAFLELDPASFDVNVHPGKRDIRFKDERDIFELVSSLVAGALVQAKAPAPLWRETAVAVADTVPAHYLGGRTLLAQEPVFHFDAAAAQALETAAGAPRWWTPPYRFLGQIERSYLLFEAAGGLLILDQHAAQERILYEKLVDDIARGALRSQKLMLPLPVELPASALQKVLARQERLSALGFAVTPYGKTVLHVLAAPSTFARAADLKDLVYRLMDALEDPVEAARAVQHDALALVACKAAVKAHDPLGEKEALVLIETLKDCRDGSACPHGRRALLSMTRDELARRFQRPGAVPL